jgi:hypothetical protein
MHIALPGTSSRPVAALAVASRPVLNGQHALIAVIMGVTWLALIGGVLANSILSSGGGASHHTAVFYIAYNSGEVVPTSFGSMSVATADLTTQADLVEVHLSMRVDNKQDTQIDAPRFEDLRLLNSDGVEAKPKSGGWSGPAVIIAHSSATVDLTYLAAADMGLLWLDYRDAAGPYPIRVIVGNSYNARSAVAGLSGDAQ